MATKRKVGEAGDTLHEQSPRLATVISRNIEKIEHLRAGERENHSLQDRVADAITDFSGRMRFVYLHIAWFAGWIIANSGAVGLTPFDPFPYSLLTMVVSLEAIFLSAFVLITQNRMSLEAERRADLHLHVDLLAEHELTRALCMLDAIRKKLGIEEDDDEDLPELEVETRPEDVLAAIRHLEREMRAKEMKAGPDD
ncbi:MAG TPA: DUF1003 domain-containing protein [Gemmatimonadales bacterium]|nr:DUF1003 domain-containing protein [Gemmatimonadales bacterium]